MKAEEIIAMDTKNNQKVLSKWEENSPYLLEVRTRYCKKCKKQTSQEWVRNTHFEYWRCAECLEKQLKEKGIFTPQDYFKRGTQYLEA